MSTDWLSEILDSLCYKSANSKDAKSGFQIFESKELSSLVESAEQAILAKLDEAIPKKVLAYDEANKGFNQAIDQINQIRHSDTKLNHGTIELMGYMSQDLNKKRQAELNSNISKEASDV